MHPQNPMACPLHSPAESKTSQLFDFSLQVQQKGKLLTVFSSSRYCGGANEAACVLCDASKLRLIRLDTT